MSSLCRRQIGALLTELASQPRLLAACLAADAASTAAVAHDGVERLSRIVVSGVHGNALLRADEAGVLRVLRALGDTQVRESFVRARIAICGSSWVTCESSLELISSDC